MSIDVEPPVPDIEATGDARSNRSILFVTVLAVVLVAAITAVLIVQARHRADTAAALATRQAQVEQNGDQVMPFDQDLTTHRFAKTDVGGVETVTANDPNDTEQAALVRDHLEHERDLLSTGDFSDPMAIHGHQMPGIADLQQGARTGRVTVTYETLPAGARLTYTATNPALVDAVHEWFDAQLMDHGSHATE